MKKLMSYIVFIFLALYICAAIYLYVYQRNFLYFPTGQIDHPFEQISISNQSESIQVIVLNKGKPRALLYFGGNAEAVVANGQDFLSHFPDTTTYLVNYRGYGGSSGNPTEQGIFSDALAAYDHVSGSHSHISTIGRSLGSGVATYLATKRNIATVALVTPYDSILNVAKSQFPVFPVKLLLKDHFDSSSRAKHVNSKVLVVAAEHDRIIPMKHTQVLMNAFQEGQVKLKVIEETGHNSISSSGEYFIALTNFLR